MDASYFSSQFQMVMYQLIFTLLNEKLNNGASTSTTEAEVADVSATKSAEKTSSVSGKFADIIQAAAAKYDVDAD
jgi:hypothetical protein